MSNEPIEQELRTHLRPSRPPRTRLADLPALGGTAIPANAGLIEVTGISLRAQDTEPGDLFAALPGARAHGAQFVRDAVARGARAVLTDSAGAEIVRTQNLEAAAVPLLVHPSPRGILGEVSAEIYGRPSERMQLIGVTGTSGKTTTSYLIEAGLMAAGRRVGLVGTVETRINGRRSPSVMTTPEAPQLQALFAAMVEAGVDAVVMEVSSHALSLGRVEGTHFEIGAFTNLSQDHLDFHDTLEDYFQAKARLFAGSSGVHATRAVVCVDDAWGQRMATLAAEPAVTVSSSGTDADWVAGEGAIGPDGNQQFTVRGPGGRHCRVQTRLPGRYNVANATLALAVLDAAGIDTAAAIEGLATVDVPGRMERVDRGQGFLAVVDYAHKPAAVEAVIDTLRAQCAGRVGVVVGAGGDRDAGKRWLMGAAGARGADLLIITDDNPRSEDPALIRAALLEGARSVQARESGEVREVGDRAAAIDAAVRWARAGDVVLIAGKGHETGQEINGVKHPFDDREVLAAALERQLAEQAAGKDGTP